MIKLRGEYGEIRKLLEMKLKIEALLVILVLKFESAEFRIVKILRNGVLER